MWKLEEIKRFFQLFFEIGGRERKTKMELESDNLEEERGEHRDELRKIFLERWHANNHLLFSLSTVPITVNMKR